MSAMSQLEQQLMARNPGTTLGKPSADMGTAVGGATPGVNPVSGFGLKGSSAPPVAAPVAAPAAGVPATPTAAPVTPAPSPTQGLIPGVSGGVLMQNVRTLRSQGIPEAQAIQMAQKFAQQGGGKQSGMGGSTMGALTGF